MPPGLCILSVDAPLITRHLYSTTTAQQFFPGESIASWGRPCIFVRVVKFPPIKAVGGLANENFEIFSLFVSWMIVRENEFCFPTIVDHRT